MGDIIGVNERWYPAQNKSYDGGRTLFLVVLKEGSIGDYAAYVGCGQPEWVAAHGDKLSFDEARIHFPYLDEAKYRP